VIDTPFPLLKLPFGQIDAICALLTTNPAWLTNLAAVLTHRAGGPPIFVYLNEPVGQVRGCAQIHIADLCDNDDLAAYDGPRVGFAAIDLLRPDLATKGPTFYALDHIFRQQGRTAELRAAWRTLGCFLFDRWREGVWRLQPKQQERAVAHIHRLIAPSILAQAPRRDLLALLPDADLEAYIADGRCRLVYRCLPDTLSVTAVSHLVEEFTQPNYLGAGQALLALEELCCLRDDVLPDDQRFQELRTILRRSGLGAELAATIAGLSKECAARVEADPTRAPFWRQLHYMLAVESQLGQIDVEDLIGVFLPHDDLGEQREDGRQQWTLLYRCLHEAVGLDDDGPRVLSLLPLRGIAQWPDLHGQVLVSLLPLRSLLLMPQVQQWHDLGPVLRNAGKVEQLARSGWLLARDLLAQLPSEPAQRTAQLADLERTIYKSCTLLSVEDPWRRRNSGYGLMLHAVYTTLVEAVDLQAEMAAPPARSFYLAMSAWYRSALLTDADEIEAGLHTLVEQLRWFEQESGSIDVSAAVRNQAQRMLQIGEALRTMLSGSGQPESVRLAYAEAFKVAQSNIPQVVREGASMTVDVLAPSVLFRSEFHRYIAITADIQQTQTSQVPIEDKVARLRAQVRQLYSAQRTLFAVYHGQRVLDLLYTRAIEQTAALLERLQGRALVDVELVTESVAQHEENMLTVVVKNSGRVDAHDVEIELLTHARFRLLETDSTKRLAFLPAYTTERVQFRIVPLVSDDLPVRLRTRYDGGAAPAEPSQTEALVHVHSLDRGPFRPKSNPYVYGTPLQDYRLFYGRRHEIATLLEHLASGRPQHFLLRGARRSGKTSMLYMLKAILEDRSTGSGTMSAQIGVRASFDVPEAWNASLDAVQPVLMDMQGIDRMGERLTSTEFYRAMLDALACAALETAESTILRGAAFIRTAEFEQVLLTLRRARPGLRFLFLLDEFDVVDLIVDKAFYGQLRHIITTVPGVTWIIVSALGLYKDVHEYESPLFNVFKIVDLDRLEADPARRLVLDPWQRRGSYPVGVDDTPTLYFTDDSIEAILYETGCYPYFIQLLCSATVEQVNRARTNYVLHATVYTLIEKLIAPGSEAFEHFEYLWVHAGSVGQAILLTLLGSVEPPTQKELRAAVLTQLEERCNRRSSHWATSYADSLRRLQRVEAVRLETNNRYRFGIPLFRRLLARRSEREELWETMIHVLCVEPDA